MFAATFREKNLSLDEGYCDAGKINGESRLYTIGMDTGESGWWSNEDTKYLSFHGIKITGFTVSRIGAFDTLVITYSTLDDRDAQSSINENVNREKDNGLSKDPNPDMPNLQVALGSSAGANPVSANDSVINYWRFTD